ncbi:hypothetical protein Tco_1366173 [Tanacetum coccineum]
MEEIDLFLADDGSIPPGIESDDFDSVDDDTSISLPEFESFHVDYPNSENSTIDVVEDIPVDVLNVLPTLELDFIPSSESIFAYVVWIFLPFLFIPVIPPYLLYNNNNNFFTTITRHGLQVEEQEELFVEEKAKLFHQLLEQRRKHFAAKRTEEKRNKLPTHAQQRKIVCTYLKNMEGKKLKDLKNKSFDSIQKMFDRSFKGVNTFVDFRTDLVEGSSKRAGEELEQESTKK